VIALLRADGLQGGDDKLKEHRRGPIEGDGFRPARRERRNTSIAARRSR